MKLLTKEEADIIIEKALIMVVNHRESKYRFGQAIFNELPLDLGNHFTATEYDFFYWRDDDKVFKTFWEHYVEKNDEN